MGCLETVSSAMKKTMLVPTLSPITRGEQKGALHAIRNHLQMFKWPPCARGEWLLPYTLGSVLPAHSHMAVQEGIFLPTPQYPSWAAEISRGKGISRQTSKGREEKAEVGPSPTSYPHPKQRKNPRLDIHRNHRG